MKQELHVVQRAAKEDKDLVASIEEHRNAIPGKKDTGKTRTDSNCKPPEVEVPEAPGAGRQLLCTPRADVEAFAPPAGVDAGERKNTALTLALNDAVATPRSPERWRSPTTP